MEGVAVAFDFAFWAQVVCGELDRQRSRHGNWAPIQWLDGPVVVDVDQAMDQELKKQTSTCT